MAITKETDNNRCWQGFREFGTLRHHGSQQLHWWKSKTAQPLGKSLEILQNVKHSYEFMATAVIPLLVYI